RRPLGPDALPGAALLAPDRTKDFALPWPPTHWGRDSTRAERERERANPAAPEGAFNPFGEPQQAPPPTIRGNESRWRADARGPVARRQRARRADGDERPAAARLGDARRAGLRPHGHVLLPALALQAVAVARPHLAAPARRRDHRRRRGRPRRRGTQLERHA